MLPDLYFSILILLYFVILLILNRVKDFIVTSSNMDSGFSFGELKAIATTIENNDTYLKKNLLTMKGWGNDSLSAIDMIGFSSFKNNDSNGTVNGLNTIKKIKMALLRGTPSYNIKYIDKFLSIVFFSILILCLLAIGYIIEDEGIYLDAIEMNNLSSSIVFYTIGIGFVVLFSLFLDTVLEITHRLKNNIKTPKWFYVFASGLFVSSFTGVIFSYGISLQIEYYNKILDIQEKIILARLDEMRLGELENSRMFEKYFTSDVLGLSINAISMELMVMAAWLFVGLFTYTFHKKFLK